MQLYICKHIYIYIYIYLYVHTSRDKIVYILVSILVKIPQPYCESFFLSLLTPPSFLNLPPPAAFRSVRFTSFSISFTLVSCIL